MGSQEFAAAYKAELKELKVAEKPVINMLTMLAEDNKQHAQAVVGAIESHLREVSTTVGGSLAGAVPGFLQPAGCVASFVGFRCCAIVSY